MSSNLRPLTLNRRRFLTQTSLLASGLVAGSTITASAASYARIYGANGRLDIGAIGVGGRGAGDLDAVSSENIVALCDVDANMLTAAGNRMAFAHSRLATYAR
jgi:hypothetical protein